MSHLRDGRVITYDLDPVGLGCAVRSPKICAATTPRRTPACYARSWRAKIAARAALVLFNAAAALAVDHGDLLEGLREAERALDSGAAQGKLDAPIALSQALGRQNAE